MRCGRCATVFDGIANLFDPEPPATAEPAPPQPGLFDSPVSDPSPAPPTEPAAKQTTPDEAASRDFDEETSRGDEPAQSTEMASDTDAPPSAAESASVEETSASTESPATTDAAPVEGEGSASDPVQDDGSARPEPLLEDFLAEPKPRRSRLATAAWGLLALVALTALAFQVVVRYRAEIAVVAPQARGVLEAACLVAHCELRLPRRVEFVTIESSELQADPRRENLIQLDAVIRNRAPFAQEFPALELTLTDDADSPVVRRVLTPADYLGTTASQAAAGMAPQSETPVRMRFDNSQARATGYKLYLFYP